MVRRNFFPFRNDLFANFGAVSASGVEFAAFRRIYRAGDIAFEDLKVFVQAFAHLFIGMQELDDTFQSKKFALQGNEDFRISGTWNFW